MKKIINIDTYNNLLPIIIKNGIDDNIFDTAKKMDLDIVKLINDNVINTDDKQSLEIAKTTLLGVFGNYFTAYYYKKLGYEVETEKPLYDKKGNELTRVDISYKDKNSNTYLCEVKTAFQIIDNMRNYVDVDSNINRAFYTDKDEEIIKYKNIGKKLIKQATRLKQYSNNVNVIIFEGCIMDEVIKQDLGKLGVRIVVLGSNIYDLYNYITGCLLKIKGEYNNSISDIKLIA